MLSAETATGKFPVKAVTAMNNVATEAEKYVKPVGSEFLDTCEASDIMAEAVSQAAVRLATILKAKALILYTTSGFTVRITTMFRPSLNIYAFTADKKVANLVGFYRGVIPILMDEAPESFESFITDARTILTESGVLQPGDTVVASNINSRLSTHSSNALRVFVC